MSRWNNEVIVQRGGRGCGHGVSYHSWWDVVGDLWMHGVGCVACATWWGVMRSERVGRMMCDMRGCGACGCRKVPCVVHNGVRTEKVPHVERKGAHKCIAGGCKVVRGGVARFPVWYTTV